MTELIKSILHGAKVSMRDGRPVIVEYIDEDGGIWARGKYDESLSRWKPDGRWSPESNPKGSVADLVITEHNLFSIKN